MRVVIYDKHMLRVFIDRVMIYRACKRAYRAFLRGYAQGRSGNLLRENLGVLSRIKRIEMRFTKLRFGKDIMVISTTTRLYFA